MKCLSAADVIKLIQSISVWLQQTNFSAFVQWCIVSGPFTNDYEANEAEHASAITKSKAINLTLDECISFCNRKHLCASHAKKKNNVVIRVDGLRQILSIRFEDFKPKVKYKNVWKNNKNEQINKQKSFSLT